MTWRDRNTTEALKAAGWTVLRFWEHDDLTAAARKVAATLVEPALETRGGGIPTRR